VIAGAWPSYYLYVNRCSERHCGAVAVFLGLSLPVSAHAEETRRLRYQAPSGCPTEAEFVAAVAERGGQLQPDAPGREPNAFEVAIEQRDDGFHAALSVRSEAGMSNPREVHAESCAQVVDALAAVTAIALNQPAPAPAPAAEFVPSSSVQRDPSAAARGPLRGGGDIWSKSIDVQAGKLHLDRALSVMAFAGPVLGFVPARVMQRLDVSVSRANFVTIPSGQSYLMGTIVRLRASLLFDQTYRFGDLRTEVGGQEFGASLCYSPYYDTAGWVLLGCAEISAGLMGLRSTNASGATTQNKTMGFGAIGLGIEASYSLSKLFQLGLRLGAQTLTSRITAERPDGSELFHSSPVIASGTLGFGVHF
jgi:hypothetical protein